MIVEQGSIKQGSAVRMQDSLGNTINPATSESQDIQIILETELNANATVQSWGITIRSLYV